MYLAGWELTSVETSCEGTTLLAGRFLLHPAACPQCGSLDLRVHSTKPRFYVDAPVHRARVSLRADRSRYACANGHTFIQPIDDLDADASITARARRYIEHQSLRASFAATADRLGLSPNTVADLSHRYFDSIAQCKRPASAPTLCAVDVSAGGRTAVLLLDATRMRAIDLIDPDHAAALDTLRDAVIPEAVRYQQSDGARSQALLRAAIPHAQDDALSSAAWALSFRDLFAQASARVAFAGMRARVQLWGDSAVLHSALLAEHEESCQECLAMCRPEEMVWEQTRVTIEGKPQWRRHRVCTACATLRTPTWFHRPDEFV